MSIRTARCTYYGRPGRYVSSPSGLCTSESPSDTPTLAFFEDKGPGSRYASEICSCGSHETVHAEIAPTGRPGITDHEFTPTGPAEFDRYYCGCKGWD